MASSVSIGVLLVWCIRERGKGEEETREEGGQRGGRQRAEGSGVPRLRHEENYL